MTIYHLIDELLPRMQSTGAIHAFSSLKVLECALLLNDFELISMSEFVNEFKIQLICCSLPRDPLKTISQKHEMEEINNFTVGPVNDLHTIPFES
jgi:hypothetical protein